MTDGTAGWFRDPNDPALARWHDGDRWTEHTLVIADQTPGSEPAPPVITPDPAPTSAFDSGGFGSGWDNDYTSSTPSQGRGGLPGWAKIVAPIAVIAVAAAAFFILSGGSDDEPGDKTETNGVEVASLDEAVDAARDAGLPDEVSDQRAAALIERICDAADDPTEVDELGTQLGSLPADSAPDLRQSVAALGIGANRRCADALDDEPDLINDLQDAAVVAFATTTTSPTILPDGATDSGAADAGTDGGAGTGGTTGTTRKGSGSTGTTAKPTTTTTAKPLPQVLPNTSCSNEGAKAIDKTTGGSLTCAPGCYGPSKKLVWQKSVCTPATQPTSPSGSTPPTPTTATTLPGQCVPPNCDG